jgi:hypothetical protein
MGVFLAVTAAMCIWVVIWALGINAIDGFMAVLVIILLAAIGRIVWPFLPGNRPGDY